MKKQNCVVWIQIVFVVYRKTDNIYKKIAENVETRFDPSNYELDRLLPKGKNKKVTGLMKDELSGKIVTTYSYLIDESIDDKKTQKCVS